MPYDFLILQKNFFMPLLLPVNYPLTAFLQNKMAENRISLNSDSLHKNTIKLAIVNIMPEAEKYEELLLKQLVDLPQFIEIVFIKLKTHLYKSSDKLHLNTFYHTFEELIKHKELDGLIITGAPVELLDFATISYYDELIEIMNYANLNIKSTLGICWGGIFIGHFLGIKNQIFRNKISGVFPAEYSLGNFWLKAENLNFNCPQSRYAGLVESQLSEAEENGLINVLCKSAEAGSFIFESTDHRFVAHLGHPEYEVDRIMFEYQRDQAKGLNIFPKYFDVLNPVNNWKNHSTLFFANWIKLIDN
jgi:homoserine O-succinyltransferase